MMWTIHFGYREGANDSVPIEGDRFLNGEAGAGNASRLPGNSCKSSVVRWSVEGGGDGGVVVVVVVKVLCARRFFFWWGVGADGCHGQGLGLVRRRFAQFL